MLLFFQNQKGVGWGFFWGHKSASGGSLYLLLLHAKISAPCSEIQKPSDSSGLETEAPECFSCFSGDGC